MSEITHIAHKLDKKWATSLKQVGNQVKALTKNSYIQDVLPNISNYYVTIKADGLRCFLMISEKSIKYITSKKTEYLQIHNIFKTSYIFDCELVDDIIYIFDVIEFNSENVSNQTFEQRYKKLLEFKEQLLEKK